ncbi:hypothetical protein LTS18_013042 [Coniosporium uncinatum]|uniref:Uncharacterized protein n=1 Tax=Coniosporium uncinatum TaxID=93489 RepID=A0ACC3CWQ6_9PEZI|nr:hypothetical protein LTS18_013042 [Coniosporium uncinatum]
MFEQNYRHAHRLRDMQKLPYVVVTNSHLSHVYELYYKAFDKFRKVSEIKTVDDNDRWCNILRETLNDHLTAIPRLVRGILEVQGTMKPEETDKFTTTMLKSRISRRVIAEQHLALTETFHSPWHFPDARPQQDSNVDFVGEVFLKCNAKEVIEGCAEATRALLRGAYGDQAPIPEIRVEGHLDAHFPYILSHLEYIIGELLRNSIQAVAERGHRHFKDGVPPPIEVLICETAQNVIIRISDQGGGVPREILPYLWSFSKGPPDRRNLRLQHLERVPKMAATMQEVRTPDQHIGTSPDEGKATKTPAQYESSLTTLSSRPPNLCLGIGLPMSRIYAEYWAGSLELHSLEGYGVDAFLQISKLGNKNEQLTTRASMDAV